VADLHRPGPATAVRPSELAAHRAVLVSRLRAQVAYRTSFGFDIAASVMLGLADLTEVYILFHNVKALGGLDFRGALLVFGLSRTGFAIANAVAGQLDSIPTYIRAGTLDVLLLRPQPVLAQILTGDVQLRRLGSMVVALSALAAALGRGGITWTPAKVALLALTPLVSAVLFAGLFLAAGAAQFWLVDAAEVTNSFTYGSSYAGSFSSAVLPMPLRLLFAFAIPAAFTAYLPVLVILDLPGPAGLPAWLGWCAPAAAVFGWAVALGAWRAGLRHYTGAGG
jgi:ABC-2 type transport system permease protein